MNIVIETENLTKIFSDRYGKVTAVDNVNLKIPEKTVTGLIGHNGAGKTTLISMLVGLILPTSGNGRVLGYDIVKESFKIREKVGLLPEGFGFYDHLTAYKNLEYIALLNHIPREKIKNIIEEVLEEVGLKKYMHMSVKGFSRGMKQRLGIAQALLKNPDILILDEPTAGIDPEGAIGFKNLIKEFVNNGKTVLISTHLLHELGDICNYAIIMKNGRVLSQGYIEDLKNRYIEEYGHVYLLKFREGEELFIKGMKDKDHIRVERRNSYIRIYSKKDVIDEINEIIKSDKILVEEIRYIKPSLEKLFLYHHFGKVVEL